MTMLWEYLLLCNLFSVHSFVELYFQGTITYNKKETNIESDGFLSWLHEVFFLLLNYRLAQFYSESLPRFALLFWCFFHLQNICPFRNNPPHVVVVCLLPLVIGNLSNTSVAEHRKGCWTWPCIVDVVDCRDFDLCYVCDRLEVTIMWKILPYGARNPRMKCRYVLGVMPHCKSWLTL
jgi:hypothetical protein